MCPAEVIRIVHGSNKRVRDQHELHRALVFEAARLVTFAYHAPKDMPKYEAIGAGDESAAEAEHRRQVDDIKVRGYLMGLAARG